MTTTCRLATLSTLVALLGLSACVWDRGMSHGYRDGRSGDREHDDDCRASNRR
jgi:hypothetical protein